MQNAIAFKFKHTTMDKIGHNFKKERTTQELTQEELAKKCGLTARTIINLENNTHVASMVTIIKVCKGLDIRIEKILY